MCACTPGFVCSRCQGTRFADDYADPLNQVSRPEEAPAESLARPSFACEIDESAGLAEFTRG